MKLWSQVFRTSKLETNLCWRQVSRASKFEVWKFFKFKFSKFETRPHRLSANCEQKQLLTFAINLSFFFVVQWSFCRRDIDIFNSEMLQSVMEVTPQTIAQSGQTPFQRFELGAIVSFMQWSTRINWPYLLPLSLFQVGAGRGPSCSWWHHICNPAHYHRLSSSKVKHVVEEVVYLGATLVTHSYNCMGTMEGTRVKRRNTTPN